VLQAAERGRPPAASLPSVLASHSVQCGTTTPSAPWRSRANRGALPEKIGVGQNRAFKLPGGFTSAWMWPLLLAHEGRLPPNSFGVR